MGIRQMWLVTNRGTVTPVKVDRYNDRSVWINGERKVRYRIEQAYHDNIEHAVLECRTMTINRISELMASAHNTQEALTRLNNAISKSQNSTATLSDALEEMGATLTTRGAV